jgi:hypothetical protein
MKILEKVMYVFYGISMIFNLYLGIKTKDSDKLCIALWIFNTAIMFMLYRKEEKFGDERVEWRNEFIKELLSDNLANLEEDKHCCIHYKNKKPEILYAPRKLLTEKFKKVEEAKKIASNIIGCEYVDGRNLEIDGKYVAGVYIDDLEMMTQRHEMVIINEIDGLNHATCEKIIEYLKEDNDFTKELKKYELI